MAKKNNPQDDKIEEMLRRVLGQYQEILFKAANSKRDEDVNAYKERFFQTMDSQAPKMAKAYSDVVLSNIHFRGKDIPDQLRKFGSNYTGNDILLTTYSKTFDVIVTSLQRYKDGLNQKLHERQARNGRALTLMEILDIIKGYLKKKEVNAVEYANGRSVPVDKYSAMLARTARAETENLSMIGQALREGIDLVECDIVSPTCDSCAVYQGRVYSISGKDKRYPALYQTAFKSGYSIIHPNCRHSWSPYRTELYSEEEKGEALERSNRSWQPDGDGRHFQQTEKLRTEYAQGEQKRRQWNAEIVEYERMKDHYKKIGQEPPYKTLGAFRREARKPVEKQSIAMQEWKLQKRQINLYANGTETRDKDLTNVSSDDIILNEQSRKAIGSDVTTLQQAIENTPKLVREAFKKNQEYLRILDAHYITTDKQVAHFSPEEGGIRFDIETDKMPSDDYRTQYQTYFHETGHNLDYVIGKRIKGKGYASSEYKSPNHTEEILYYDKKGNVIGRATRNLSFDDMIKKEGEEFIFTYRQLAEKRIGRKVSKKEVYNEIYQDFKDEPLVNKRQLSDILDGVTNGEMRRVGYDLGASHTKRTPDYWKSHIVGTEAFAHFTSVLSTNPKNIEMLIGIFPKSYAIYEEIIQK